MKINIFFLYARFSTGISQEALKQNLERTLPLLFSLIFAVWAFAGLSTNGTGAPVPPALSPMSFRQDNLPPLASGRASKKGCLHPLGPVSFAHLLNSWSALRHSFWEALLWGMARQVDDLTLLTQTTGYVTRTRFPESLFQEAHLLEALQDIWRQWRGASIPKPASHR